MTLTEALAALKAAGKIRNWWLPGMAVQWVKGRAWEREPHRWDGTGVPHAIDTTDAATAGVLLALLREAIGDPTVYVMRYPYSEEDLSCVKAHEIIDRSKRFGGPLAKQCSRVMDVIPGLKIRARGKLHDLETAPMEQRVQAIAERTGLSPEEVQVTIDYLLEQGHLPWTT